ncbi:MAG: hypothetical protein H6605_03230 [Flavobacteriales bacterium]|nr:hypothetical protein [Flavobacteriales bacterium]
MKGLKIIKILLACFAFMILMDSCASKTYKRGCDGRQKVKVPFGRM